MVVKNFPGDLDAWKTQGFHTPAACEANYQHWYDVLQSGLPNFVGLAFFPFFLIPTGLHLTTSVWYYLPLAGAMIATVWGFLVRQWHRRRDAETYLREDLNAWIDANNVALAKQRIQSGGLLCRIFGHHHPRHGEATRPSNGVRA